LAVQTDKRSCRNPQSLRLNHNVSLRLAKAVSFCSDYAMLFCLAAVSSFHSHAVMAFPSVFAATSHTSIPAYNHNPSSVSSTHPLYNPYYYGAWALPQGKADHNQHTHSSYHYRDTWVTNPVKSHGQPFPSHHRDELRWQQPYTGSRPDASQPHPKASQEQEKDTVASYGQTLGAQLVDAEAPHIEHDACSIVTNC
jgi:hypothetical protein